MHKKNNEHISEVQQAQMEQARTQVQPILQAKDPQTVKKQIDSILDCPTTQDPLLCDLYSIALKNQAENQLQTQMLAVAAGTSATSALINVATVAAVLYAGFRAKKIYADYLQKPLENVSASVTLINKAQAYAAKHGQKAEDVAQAVAQNVAALTKGVDEAASVLKKNSHELGNIVAQRAQADTQLITTQAVQDTQYLTGYVAWRAKEDMEKTKKAFGTLVGALLNKKSGKEAANQALDHLKP